LLAKEASSNIYAAGSELIIIFCSFFLNSITKQYGKIDEPIVIHQIFVNSIETVWAAITNLDQMLDWYFPNISAFEPTVGF
jgi:hypothetical protein